MRKRRVDREQNEGLDHAVLRPLSLIDHRSGPGVGGMKEKMDICGRLACIIFEGHDLAAVSEIARALRHCSRHYPDYITIGYYVQLTGKLNSCAQMTQLG